VPTSQKTRASAASRDPERTRQRILEAALKEFSARGFAGARVDAIAARAAANKRMLYHYFGDKEGLFRAVLRYKMNDRLTRIEAQLPGAESASRMPLWFQQNCQDADWVRLLAWESLQTVKNKVLDEKERRRLARRGTALIRRKQQAGRLRNDVPAAFLQLAKMSLTMFPVAMPQLARLIAGRSPHDPRFQREYGKFLETISNAFRPSRGAGKAKAIKSVTVK
jgi:AcrR family transcriptional regulator